MKECWWINFSIDVLNRYWRGSFAFLGHNWFKNETSVVVASKATASLLNQKEIFKSIFAVKAIYIQFLELFEYFKSKLENVGQVSIFFHRRHFEQYKINLNSVY